MNESADMNVNSSAVQSHLTIVQGVIERMAENSRSCKVWCITLVSATLILVARTDKPEYALIALIPAVLFLILDAYYLALERGFRGAYIGFVKRLHENKLALSDLYLIAPDGSIPKHFGASLGSFSIWPFYPTLVVMVLIVWLVLSK